MTKKIAIFVDNDFYFIILFCRIFLKHQDSSRFIIFIGKDFINFKRVLITFFSLPFFEFYKVLITVLKNKNKKVLENFLIKKKIEFYHSENINSKKVIKILNKNRIKNIFSVINSKIFKKKKFNKYNIFNLHLGRIPNYKGIVPVINALLKKEKVFYSSIFTISFKGIDTGKLVKESFVLKKNSTNTIDLYTKLYKKGFYDLLNLSQELFLRKKINILRTINKKDGIYYKYPKFIDILKIKKIF